MKQIDLVEACTRRETGIERVRESHGDEWVQAAAQWLHHYANTSSRDRDFLIEDAALAFPGEPARNSKAWGPAALYARRAGWIVRVGYAPARTSNLSPKCTWRAA